MARSADASVDALLDARAHPRRNAIDRYRRLLLDTAPGVLESWKWSAPNYALAGDFATFRLQPRQAFQLILHAGSAKGGLARISPLSAAPGLLSWPASDRCVLALDRLPEGADGERVFSGLVRHWLQALGRV